MLPFCRQPSIAGTANSSRQPCPRGVDATRACKPALLALPTTAGRPVHGVWVQLSTALPFILAPFSTAGGAADPTCGDSKRLDLNVLPHIRMPKQPQCVPDL